MSAIRLLLTRARRRRIVDAAARGGVAIGLWIGGALALMVGLAPSLAPWPFVRGLVGLGLVLATAWIFQRGFLAGVLDAGSLRAAARRLEARHPELRGSLITAMELEAEARQGVRHYSRDLARAALARADRRVAGLAADGFGEARRRWGGVLAAGLSLAIPALLTIAAPRPVGEGIRAFLGADLIAQWWRGVASADEASLEVGDLTVTYHYPAYTGLKDRILAHSTGAVRALLGTDVTVEATADRDGERAYVALDDGRRRNAAVENRRRMSATLTLSGEGGYRFVLAGPGGREWRSKRFPILTEPDNPPRVAFLYPTGDLDVHDLDSVKLEFSAEDDFGLGAAELVVDRDGVEEARPIGRAPEGVAKWNGEYLLEVASLGLKAGGSVVVFVRVADNDGVLGPKQGTSERRVLRVVGRAEEQRHLIELEQGLLDEAVGLLGDYLEFAPREPRDGAQLADFGERTLKTLGTLSANIGGVLSLYREDDESGDGPTSPARHLLETLDAHLAETAATLETLMSAAAGVEEWRAHGVERIGEFERDVLALDRLIYDQSLDNLVGLSEGVLDQQRSLEELLNRMADGLAEPEALAALERQVDQIEQALSDIANQVKRMASGLPEEFVNSDAMDSLESDRIDALLQEMREALAAGDTKRAGELAQELMEALTKMTSALDDAYSLSTGGAEGSETLAKIEENLARIDALAREQERIKSETERLENARREREGEAAARRDEARQARLGELLDELDRSVLQSGRALREGAMLYTRMARDWQELDGAVPPLRVQIEENVVDLAREQSRVVEGFAGTFARDVERYRELGASGQEWPDELGPESKNAEKVAAEIATILDAMMRTPQASPGEEGREQTARAAGDQRELSDRAGEAGESLEALGKQAPLLTQGARGHMEDASASMRAAAERMEEGGTERAIDDQREALYQLSQARGELDGAREQMSRSQGAGRSMNLFPRTMGRSAASARGHERVEIPDSDRSRAPRRFREDLLKAMKEKPPERYESLVRDYYKSLVE
ncbi:MAG: DUF4175 family protein [Myxococcales bacterium]|nr:DUF4175 family protein [Myxococcales bacterium]